METPLAEMTPTAKKEAQRSPKYPFMPAPNNNYPFGAEMPVCGKPVCGKPVKGNRTCVVPMAKIYGGRCPNRENHSEPCAATSRYGETNEQCRGYRYGSNCTHAHLHVRPSEQRCTAQRGGRECRGALRSDGRCTAATGHDPVPTPVFHHDAQVVPWWVNILDHHGVPRDAGVPHCARILRQRGYKIGPHVLGDVVRTRRNRV